MIVRASVRCWPRPWLAVSLTQDLSLRPQLLGLDWTGAGALERGQDRLGGISSGDRYLRGLFVAGALAVIRYARSWQHIGLGSRHCARDRPVAAIALATDARWSGVMPEASATDVASRVRVASTRV